LIFTLKKQVVIIRILLAQQTTITIMIYRQSVFLLYIASTKSQSCAYKNNANL